MSKKIISLLTLFVMLMSMCITPATLADNPILSAEEVDNDYQINIDTSTISGEWTLIISTYEDENGEGTAVQSKSVKFDDIKTYTSKLINKDYGIIVDGGNGAKCIKVFLWNNLENIQAADASLKLDVIREPEYIPSRPSGNGGTTVKYKVAVYVDGKLYADRSFISGTKADLSTLVPERDGYKLEGFYSDKEFTKKINAVQKVTKNIIAYAKYVEIAEDTEPFIKDDHFAYILGYPTSNGSNEVRPEANITREEVATIFYRLIKENIKNGIYSKENSFKDVEAGRWSNEYVSTIANGGYIKGDPEGTFRPEDNITRAEFVTIATRFYDADGDDFISSQSLKDVKGHWGENFINYAVNAGWITGYEDNTFRPDAYITRAEAMTIINRVLERKVDKAGLIEGFTKFEDNLESQWYYYEVIEATNSHKYERRTNSVLEKWTEIIK